MDSKTQKQQPIIDKIIESKHHGLVFLPTGTGKTRILIESIRNIKQFKRILWVCATEEYRDKGLKEEFVKWNAESTYKKITAICWQSLKNHKGIYDLVILDEVQKITPNNAKYFDKIDSCKILGVTGSPPRERDKRAIFSRLLLPVLWDMRVDEAVEESLIADYEITVVNVHLDRVTKLPIKTKKGSTFFTTEHESYIWYNNKYEKAYMMNNKLEQKKISLLRAGFIYRSKTKLDASITIMNKLKNKRVISFSKYTEVADLLSKNPYHSKLKKDERKLNYDKFNNEEVSHISTVEAANTSLNFKNIEVAFIQQLDSNPGNYLQRMGRALRFREGYKAEIIILCLLGTKDEIWVDECINSLNINKIRRMTLQEFLNE